MRLRQDKLMYGKETVGESDSGLEDGVTEEVSSDGSDAPAVTDFIEVANSLLQMLDNVETDSKFKTLLELLKLGLLTSDRRVCVFTRYVDTATYLESALSEHHPRVATLTGSLPISDRERIVAQFAQSGGILIATEAMLMAIPEVTGVIFYDLPLNPAVLDARIGQFVRVGRPGPVRLFAFTDESNALIIETMQRKLAEIKEALSEGELQKLLEEALG